jgi:hypothetical protein
MTGAALLSHGLPGGGRSAGVLLDAVRCWRRAKDNGRAVQPSLFAALSRDGQEMLAPVFDSLITLFEAALGRRLAVGPKGAISPDERLLLSLLGQSRRCAGCLRCPRGVMETLENALSSTRIMIRLGAASWTPPPGCLLRAQGQP